MQKIEITCRFCPKVVVTLEFAMGQKLDVEAIKKEFIDNRCAEHEAEFGSFKEMEKDYLEKMDHNHDNFMKLLTKANFKKDKFDILLKKNGKI